MKLTEEQIEVLEALKAGLDTILAGDSDKEDAPAKKTKTASTKAPAKDEDDLSEMAYNDLKKLCKERNLSASGNREELIARLNGDDAEDEEPSPKKSKSKSKPKEEEEDEAEAEDDEDEEVTTADAVAEATEDMSLEELADFCKDNDLSPKGKREALLARIVKAVDAGDIELGDDDEEEEEEEEEEPAPAPKKSKGKKKEPEPEEEEEEEDEDDASDFNDLNNKDLTKERRAAIKAFEKETRSSFKSGEITRDDLVEFMCDFNNEDKKTYKKVSDSALLDAYIDAAQLMFDDEGELHEGGDGEEEPYTVNGINFCCGHALVYDKKKGAYHCSVCDGTYEADED